MAKPTIIGSYIVFYAGIGNSMKILGKYLEADKAMIKCEQNSGSKVAHIIHMSKRIKNELAI